MMESPTDPKRRRDTKEDYTVLKARMKVLLLSASPSPMCGWGFGQPDSGDMKERQRRHLLGVQGEDSVGAKGSWEQST